MSDNNENEKIHFKNMQEYLDYFSGTSPYGRAEGTQMRDKHGRPMFDKSGRPLMVPGTPAPDANTGEGDDKNGDDSDSGGNKRGRFRLW